MPMTMPGPSALNPGQARDEALQDRRDEQQREVAVHDRRHARQDLQDRLDHPAHGRGGAYSLR